ncbi:MAG TPA: hypothetical protein VGF89_13485 [Steroidobacteraceae bacterium]|jgi:hypothetical protein
MLRESISAANVDIQAREPEAATSAVSWGAIFAGGVAAAALTLILLAFGAGVGFSAVSPWSAASSSTAFHIGVGLYFIVTAMLASAVGGYLAGRLRSRWIGVHSREVFFRDTAHGFLAWALATLLSAVALTSAAGTLVNGASAAITRVGGQTPSLIDGYADSLVRAEPSSSGGTGMGEATSARAEAGRIFASAFQNGGDFSALDRAYLAQLVSVRAGITGEQAEQRVSATIDRAKTAVDQARKAARQMSLWLTASLLIGAFAASLAALEGGGLRDGTWHYSV